MPQKRFVLKKSDLCCDHQAGIVARRPQQGFVYVENSLVITKPAFVTAPIRGCPLVQPSPQARCTKTSLTGPFQGRSGFVYINDKRVVLSHLDGFTNGLGGQSHYHCRDPRHQLVYCQP